MAYPDVYINQLSRNSGKALPGFDYYTGLIVYGTAPTVTGKWATYVGESPAPNVKAQQLFAPSDATTAGIIPYTDNTAATGSYLITAAAAAAGETVSIAITAPRPNGTTSVTTIPYVTVAGDTVIDTLGANLAAYINTLTVVNGYSASYNAGTNTLTITAPKTEGLALNSGTPIAFTNSGSVAGTITQFSAGTASQWAIWKYHVDEYFRLNPTGNLWVGVIAASSSFNEVLTLQKGAAASKLRQVGIYDTSTSRGLAVNLTGTILSVNSACDDLDTKAPLVCVYSPNLKGVTLSDLTDQNLNVAPLVQCTISQDGDAAGALLYVINGQSVGNVGAKLGTISKSRVSASDAQPISDFNVTNGVENNVMAFSNGDLATSVSGNLQIQLDTYRYTFFRQFGDTVTGTYWVGNKTCIVSTSQFCNINDNRTIQKVKRVCYSTYVPLLNSELIFNADGTLKDFTVQTFIEAGNDNITAEMITGYGNLPLISGVDVSIDPTQKVKQTENLTVDVNINQNGVARKITVNVGYTTA
jgi:hypothetical protein